MLVGPTRPGQAPLLAIDRSADGFFGLDIEDVSPLMLALQALGRLAIVANRETAEIDFSQHVFKGRFRQSLDVFHARRNTLPIAFHVMHELLSEAKPLGEVDHDGEIGSRLENRVNDSLVPLEVAVGVSAGAPLLVAGGRWQEIDAVLAVRQHCGVGDERIDIDD